MTKKIINVVGCILRHEQKILFLQRSSQAKHDPLSWGIPAGKSEIGESNEQTAIREVYEETGIDISKDNINALGKLQIEYDDWIVEFFVFYKEFDIAPKVMVSPREHEDYDWIEPREALKRTDLMKDVDIIIKEFCFEKLGMSKV